MVGVRKIIPNNANTVCRKVPMYSKSLFDRVVKSIVFGRVCTWVLARDTTDYYLLSLRSEYIENIHNGYRIAICDVMCITRSQLRRYPPVQTDNRIE